ELFQSDDQSATILQLGLETFVALDQLLPECAHLLTNLPRSTGAVRHFQQEVDEVLVMAEGELLQHAPFTLIHLNLIEEHLRIDPPAGQLFLKCVLLFGKKHLLRRMVTIELSPPSTESIQIATRPGMR